MKVIETAHKISACLFRRPILTGLVLAVVPALVSAAIVGVFVWALLSYFSCFGIPEPTWAWRPLTYLSWWVCFVTGIALAVVVLLLVVSGGDIKSWLMGVFKVLVICAIVICVSMPMLLLLCVRGHEVWARQIGWVDKNGVEHYACYSDMTEIGFVIRNADVVPVAATEIRRHRDSGFGWANCQIRCKVTRAEFEAFTKAKGYVFHKTTEHCFPTDDPVFANIPVKELLYCLAKERGVADPNNPEDIELQFLYDPDAEILYSKYRD